LGSWISKLSSGSRADVKCCVVGDKYANSARAGCSICQLAISHHMPSEDLRVSVRLPLSIRNRLAGKLLSRLKSGTMLLADRGYDADWIRALAGERGVWANIPPKYNRKDPICFSPYLYRARNLIERFFNKIKQCRRVATRYDKLVDQI
jgi:transposase